MPRGETLAITTAHEVVNGSYESFTTKITLRRHFCQELAIHLEARTQALPLLAADLSVLGERSHNCQQVWNNFGPIRLFFCGLSLAVVASPSLEDLISLRQIYRGREFIARGILR